MMKKVILVSICLLFLTGCETIVTFDRLTYHYQSSYVRHAQIVKDLREYSNVFTEPEKEYLRRINGDLNRMLQEAHTSSSEANKALPILAHYYAIKGLYKAAIELVEGKMDLFPPVVQERIKQQIQDVKYMDSEIMRTLNSNRSVSGETLLNTISIMTKFAIAVI